MHVVPGATSVPLPPEMAEQLAADPEEQRVFLGENGRAPLARPWFADLPPSAPTVEQVRADLAHGDAGRLLLDLWHLHREELLRLLDTDRRVGSPGTAAAAPRSPSSCCGCLRTLTARCRTPSTASR